MTVHKVKRNLKNDFDEDERIKRALRKVKPKVSHKVCKGRGVDDVGAREDDDVIAVETYKRNVMLLFILHVL